jgi:hypothetical protein
LDLHSIESDPELEDIGHLHIESCSAAVITSRNS